MTPAHIPFGLGDDAMNQFLIHLYIKARTLLENCQGQDIVEYAMASAVIAFGSVAAMTTLAAGVNHVFSQVSTILAQHIG
ncbi:MAG: hypothetical protein KGN79_16250 [Acidobacteriota bacterium]|nr:hypothetical protein [Acidobacteriota bacterium]